MSKLAICVGGLASRIWFYFCVILHSERPVDVIWVQEGRSWGWVWFLGRKSLENEAGVTGGCDVNLVGSGEPYSQPLLGFGILDAMDGGFGGDK